MVHFNRELAGLFSQVIHNLLYLQKHAQFNIDPWDPVIAMKIGTHSQAASIDEDSRQRKLEPKEAWVDNDDGLVASSSELQSY